MSSPAQSRPLSPPCTAPSAGTLLLGFLLPALIGNSIGGVVFVALLNHAQVKEEI